jgi:molybdopterin synthase sulfur carrier subunit
MASVEVKLFATLRREAGEKGYATEASDLGEVLQELALRYSPGFREQLKKATVLVNGRNAVLLKGKRTRLKDGDVVSLFPPMAGG